MSALLSILMALATEGPAMTGGEAPSVVACTAQRLRPFVSPTGIDQAWPTVDELPEHMGGPGLLLSSSRIVADGYSITLFVDAPSQSAYVIQQGGIAGFRTVYGPLPVAACAEATPH